ncbi:MAG: hypothetical protein Q4F24_13485 [Eubacteriales bacterium]|nr:hypothetical protein [Eubacteriales bacterium]
MIRKARLLPLLLLPLALCLTGCENEEKAAVESVITRDLDKLKNLDADTAREYISAENLFPDSTATDSGQDSVEDFISNYFQNFDYKILEIKTDKDSATASLRLNTLDAQSLARDYTGAQLQSQILDVASSRQETSNKTLQDHYQLLCQLMENNDYETVENSCTIHLQKMQDTWIIQKTAALENDIIGNFITYVSNSNLLTPEETLNIYLSTIRSMSEDQLICYLNLNQYLNNGDPTADEFTSVIIDQVMSDFTYEIKETLQEGYNATVYLDVTTFDIDAVIDNYNTRYQNYLKTPESLYAGTDGRLKESLELMQECLEKSTATTTLSVSIPMVNDGKSWTIQSPEQIGNSIFGSLTESLSFDSSCDSGYDSDYDSGYDSDSDSSYDSDYN